MLDSACNQTLILRQTANKLNLQGKSVILILSLAAGEEANPSAQREVQIFLESVSGNYSSPVFTCITTKQCIQDLERVKCDPTNFESTKGISFTEEYPQKKNTLINLLVDANMVAHLQKGPVIKGDQFLSPKVMNTLLGPSLCGAYRRREGGGEESVSALCSQQPRPSINATVIRGHCASAAIPELARFWSFEDLGIKDFVPEELSAEESLADELFLQNTVYNAEEKRFYTKLIHKTSNLSSLLDTNEVAARQMAFATRKKAIRNNTLKEVHDCYQEQVKHGAARKLLPHEIRPKDGIVYTYLPSHVVTRDSDSTRFRCVMDGSRKCPSTGHSLNSTLLPGKSLIPDILQILLVIRTRTYFFTTDCTKMFYQVRLQYPSNELTRFVWFKEGTLELEHYIGLCPPFGLVCSPFICMSICRLAAKMWGKEFPLAAKSIESMMYVDDILGSEDNYEQALETIKQISQLFELFSFKLSKWAASDCSLLDKNGISEESRNKKNIIKILGLAWEKDTDNLIFDFSHVVSEGQANTKRQILSTIAKLFDGGLGYFAPFLLIGKLILQKCFELNLGWDEAIPQELAGRWEIFKSEIIHLNNLTIPRQVIPSCEKGQQWLAVFVDASAAASGVVAYIVTKTTARILCAKSRINPLPKVKGTKANTICRLELVSAVLGARMVGYLKKVFGPTFFYKIRCFTDSTVSYWRIQNKPDKYKTWVRARLETIHQNTEKDIWNHCCGNMNVADLCTRGEMASLLVKNKLWKHAAPFILKDESTWPSFKALTKVQAQQCMEADLQELQATNIAGAVKRKFLGHIQLSLLGDRTSKWGKLIRVTAWMFRFMLSSISKLTSTPLFSKAILNQKGPLKVPELALASSYWVRVAQRESFSEYIGIKDGTYVIREGSPLVQFGAFFDDQMIIRCRTRLKSSEKLPDFTKEPILLPRNNPLIEKFIIFLHESHGHAPLATLHYYIMRSYHLWGTRRELARILKLGCFHKGCRKIKPLSAPHPPLPRERLDCEGREGDAAQIFRYISVDLAGPLEYRAEGDCECPPSIKKSWLLVGCDYLSRAIHLELLRDKSTQSFLFALEKLFTRRGVSKQIFCDNDATFRKGDLELKRLYKSIDFREVEEKTAGRGVSFVYGTPLHSSGNGIVEICVRFCKDALKRTLAGSSKLPFPQLEIICYNVEALVNSRPIGTLNDNIEDPESTVSPNTICHGRELHLLPYDAANLSELPKSQQDFTRLQRYKRTLISQAFRKWRKNYLFAIQCQKYLKPKTDYPLRKGLVVLLKDGAVNMKKNERWSLALIEEVVHSASDNVVRKVRVKNSKGNVVLRHISHICLLENTIREIKAVD